jgi:hypothetical protein
VSERDDKMGRERLERDGQRDMRLAEALDALPVPQFSEGFYDRLLAAIAADAEGRERLTSPEAETTDETSAAALGGALEATAVEARDAALGEELARLPVPELSEGFYDHLVANIAAAGAWLRVAAVAASIAVVATVGTILATRSGKTGPSAAPVAATRDVPQVAMLQYRIPRHLAVRDYSDRFAVLAAPATAKPAATKALAVLDFASGKVSRLVTRPAHARPGWKIDGMRVSGDWVVWQESGSTSDGPAYALYASRILDGPALGQARLVAQRRAVPTAALKAAGPFTFAVSGDRVVYDAPAASSQPVPASPSPTPTATAVAPSPEPSATTSTTPSTEPSASPSPTPTVTATPTEGAVEGGAAASPASLSETPAPAATATGSVSEPTASEGSATVTTARPHAVWALVSADLSNGRLTTLARSVDRPIFTVDDDEVVLWRSSSHSFVNLDLQTGRRLSKVRVVLAPRGTVAAFAAEAGWMAWIQSTSTVADESASGSLVARDPAGNRYLLGGGLSSPWFTDGYLLYEGADGALWAFDLAQKDAVRLGERAAAPGLLLRVADAGRILVAGKAPSRTGIVTLYRLSSDGEPSASPTPSASSPAD